MSEFQIYYDGQPLRTVKCDFIKVEGSQTVFIKDCSVIAVAPFEYAVIENPKQTKSETA
jgi:hypothetical protein